MLRLAELLEKLTTIKNDRRGQGFIEAMVALTIIVTSVTSALALVQSSLTSTRISGSEVIAANLAREGIEVVRSARDSAWLMGQSFEVGLVLDQIKSALPILDTVNGTWSIDISNVVIADDAARIYLTTDGVYVQASVQPTGSSVSQYARLLTLNHICRLDTDGTERIVTGTDLCVDGTETLVGLAVDSEVSFIGQSGNRRRVLVEERLYDWR